MARGRKANKVVAVGEKRTPVDARINGGVAKAKAAAALTSPVPPPTKGRKRKADKEDRPPLDAPVHTGPAPKKRGRPAANNLETAAAPPLKLGFSGLGGEKCEVLTLGQGDTGQLGLGEDVMERKRPALVKIPGGNVVDAVAGGMHTVVLNNRGEVKK